MAVKLPSDGEGDHPGGQSVTESGDEGRFDRVSVLADPALPNASPRLIALVVAGCCAAAVMLLVLVAAAVSDWTGWASLDAKLRPPVAARAAQSPLPPPPDRRLANAKLSGNPASAFSPDSDPADAISRGEQGRAVAKLAVGANGRPVRCVIATTSGSRSLDEATCRIALTRLRYRPARDGSGRPIAAEATLPVRWVLPVDAPIPQKAPENHSLEGWVPFALAGLAIFEGSALYRGLRSGRMSAPRGGGVADRVAAPRLFVFYLCVHLLSAILFAGVALVAAASSLGML